MSWVELDEGGGVEVGSEALAAAVELGYAMTEEQARDLKAPCAYVLVERPIDRPRKISYRHSHDPTSTTVFMEQEQVEPELEELCERGDRQGMYVRDWWRERHLEDQEELRRLQEMKQEQKLDRDLDMT